MATDKPDDFARAFVKRTRRYRAQTGKSMVQMALLLRADYETYRQWEKRTCMPHRYVPTFCEICRITPNELFGWDSKADS